VARAQPCQEIPLEQMSGGVLVRMGSDLSIGAALPPLGGEVRGALNRCGNSRPAAATATSANLSSRSRDCLRNSRRVHKLIGGPGERSSAPPNPYW
jgi:hypothetical protein